MSVHPGQLTIAEALRPDPREMDPELAERTNGRELDVDPSKLVGVRRRWEGVRAYRDLLSRDPCAYCGLGPPRHGAKICFIDHIHARARGGPNRWWNYTAACHFCNIPKFDNSPLAFLLQRRIRRSTYEPGSRSDYPRLRR
jgi:5-methylcytosine-specific restriction endonuclease McrA